jgi:endo-1,3(4)-beta-glucanase
MNYQIELAVSKFTYRRIGPNSSVPLLMLALPHHTHMLAQPQADARAFSNGCIYRNLKGRMSAIVGNKWIMHDKVPEINWHDNLNCNQLSGDWKQALIDSLRTDVERNQTPTISESYWFGKQIARLARLALIAEQLNQLDLLNKILDQLTQRLTPWLTSAAPNNRALFRYDSPNGGLSMPAGDRGNPDADFGHARYNDHHFHHGYFVYAATVLARKRLNWW